jgi:hypothetical protein
MEYTGAGIIATFKIKYEGADVEDYHNDHTAVKKDRVLGALVPDEICPCALASPSARANSGGAQICIRDATIKRIASRMGIAASARSHDIIREIMQKTRCKDEKCVLAVAREMQLLTPAEAGIEEQISLKRAGPTDATLFNDSVIQAQVYAWMYQFHDFWAYNFNMVNYAEASLRRGREVRKPDTLATISWADLYAGRVPDPTDMQTTPASQAMMAVKRKGVRCSTCIINSDTYDGTGKHWMTLFVDARDASATPHWTVEFFNSAAVRPEAEWLEWMVKTKGELLKVNPRANVEMVCICKVWHQHSKSECGPYSIFYTWARLNGVPPKYFMENVVPDQIMFEFRQHLFGKVAQGQSFNFDEFAKVARIKWDTEDIGNSKRTNM